MEIPKPKKRNTALEDGLYEEFKLYGCPLPERQYRFHPTRQFRADFAWPDRKILLEVQGGIFMPAGKGGHNRGGYMELEYDKQNEAVRLDWKVFKFDPKACYRPKKVQGSSQALAFMYSILMARINDAGTPNQLPSPVADGN